VPTRVERGFPGAGLGLASSGLSQDEPLGAGWRTPTRLRVAASRASMDRHIVWRSHGGFVNKGLPPLAFWHLYESTPGDHLQKLVKLGLLKLDQEWSVRLMGSNMSMEQQQDKIGDVVSSDGPDDRPEKHEIPFALVLALQRYFPPGHAERKRSISTGPRAQASVPRGVTCSRPAEILRAAGLRPAALRMTRSCGSSLVLRSTWLLRPP